MLMFGVFGAILLITGFCFYRNEWIYKHRIKIIENESKEYKKQIKEGNYNHPLRNKCLDELAGSYDSWLLTFWVWNPVKLAHKYGNSDLLNLIPEYNNKENLCE